jgi:hypothetical protein
MKKGEEFLFQAQTIKKMKEVHQLLMDQFKLLILLNKKCPILLVKLKEVYPTQEMIP